MEREEMNGNENKKEETGFHLRVKLQINTDEPVLGPGVAELLELIGSVNGCRLIIIVVYRCHCSQYHHKIISGSLPYKSECDRSQRCLCRSKP